MSVKVSSWAWSQELQSTQKMVLLALADVSDDAGRAWPGIAHMARKCCVTPRTVQRTVRELELVGLVKVEKRMRPGGRGNTSNLYHLRIDITPRINVTTPVKMSPGGMTPPSGSSLTAVSSLDTLVDTSEVAVRTASSPEKGKTARRIHGVKIWNDDDLANVDSMVEAHTAESVKSAALESVRRGERGLPSEVERILAKRTADKDKARRIAVAASDSALQQIRERRRKLADPSTRALADRAAEEAAKQLGF